MLRRAPAILALVIAVIATPAPNVAACSQPTTLSLDVAFAMAANNELPSSYPLLTDPLVHSVPVSLLMAIAWVESGWRQFRDTGQPLVSPDFGYGIMQVTSGMAGAYGDPAGSLAPAVQSRIATDYVYNIAFGAEMLAQKFVELPKIGGGDPTVLEDWYYALWAYNGWGWVNNPNNPRFTRIGTPATHPTTFPYQERVLYWMAHPPTGVGGVPLWPAVKVTLPSPRVIGQHPGPFAGPLHPHRQPPLALSASYSAPPVAAAAASRLVLAVSVVNTGTSTWTAGQMSMGYDLVRGPVNPDAISGSKWSVPSHAIGRAPIGKSLAPGEGTTVRIKVTVPKAPGSYHILWDLHDQHGWLSAHRVLPGPESLSVTPRAPAPASATATPTVLPAEGLRYIADTSIPNGTQVSAGSVLHKGWLVLNDGTTTWGPGWALHLVSGPPLGARMLAVPETEMCSTATILTTLKAPTKPGEYRATWQLEDPEGTRIGAPLSVVIRVQRPTTTPTATPQARPTATATAVG